VVDVTGIVSELRDFWGDSDPRVLIIGVGRRVRGDESAGLLVAEYLRGMLGDHQVVVAEDRPENYTDAIRRYNPSRILYVLAARSGGAPGETRLISFEKHERVLLHESPMTTLTHFLSSLMSVEVSMLLIEPWTVIGEESPGMIRTVKLIAEEIASSLPN
jgi:hydrogenase maturation protease